MTRPTLQTLTLAGEEYAVVPLVEYEALRSLADEDAVDSSIIQRALEDPHQELVPFELSTRLADGEHPVRVWREYRGLKACELAASAGVATSYLADIEKGKKPGSVNALKRIAAALNVTMNDLM